jgi:hypothetical protein
MLLSFLLGLINLSKAGLLNSAIVLVWAMGYFANSTSLVSPSPVVSLQNYLAYSHTSFVPRMIACNWLMIVQVWFPGCYSLRSRHPSCLRSAIHHSILFLRVSLPIASAYFRSPCTFPSIVDRIKSLFHHTTTWSLREVKNRVQIAASARARLYLQAGLTLFQLRHSEGVMASSQFQLFSAVQNQAGMQWTRYLFAGDVSQTPPVCGSGLFTA